MNLLNITYGGGLWIAGSTTLTFWSDNDGVSWEQATGTNPGFGTMYASDGSGTWIGGSDVRVVRSIGGKTNWTQVTGIAPDFITAGVLYNGTSWIIIGRNGTNNVYYSTTGEVWDTDGPQPLAGNTAPASIAAGPGPGPLPCFLKGTRILTPSGYKQIETLESGDHILTSDGRKVKANIYIYKIERATEDTAPYKIPAGALGNYLPSRDLHISGNHAIQDGNKVWQIPRYLAQKNATIQQHSLGEAVRYYHIECPNYRKDNLIAEGVTAESLNAKKEKVIWTKTKSGYVRELKTEYLVFNKKH